MNLILKVWSACGRDDRVAVSAVLVWDKTPVGPLRDWIVDAMSPTASREVIERYSNKIWPESFLQALDAKADDKCAYHVHEAGQRCE